MEGETDQKEIRALRKRMIKNGICLVLFSLGTPMILGGDELGRTQRGNNNAYCQDNEISWLDWKLLLQNDDLYQFTQKAIAFRKHHPILRKPTFFLGQDLNDNRLPDIRWYDAHLNPMDWNNPNDKLICYFIDGSEIPSDLGNYSLFFIFNADDKPVPVSLPRVDAMHWYRAVDTHLKHPEDMISSGNEVLLADGNRYLAKGRSVIVLLAR
jgi:isoamylase